MGDSSRQHTVPLLDGDGADSSRVEHEYVEMPDLARRHELWRAGGRKCTCSCCGLSNRAVVLASLAGVIVAMLVVFLWVLPATVQKVLDESTLVTTSMFMRNPRRDRITLNATSELHDVGPIGATMMEAAVDVYFEDEVLGTMTLPELDIVGGQVLVFNMETDMVIKNASAFTAATARILQGIGGEWYFRGTAKVRLPLGLTYSVSLNKLLKIPPTLLEDVTGSKGDVVDGSGTNTTLDMVATTSMFSSSILEMHNLGRFVFALYVKVGQDGNIVNDQASADDAGRLVKVGQVACDDFDVRQGMNELKSSGQVIKTAENEKVLSQFMSAYLEGTDQLAYMKGPVESPALYLDDVVEQPILFQGAADSRPVEVSLIDRETSFHGFKPELHRLAKNPTYRGPKIVVHNTLSARIVQRNVVSLIDLAEPISFELNHPVLGHHSCMNKKKFAKLFTAEGMYKDDVRREPIIEFGPNEKKTVFMPGGPQDGQSVDAACTVLGQPVADGADCCFVAMQVAAACRAHAAGHQSFDTELESIFEMVFDDFTIDLDVHQGKIATSFTNEIVQGFVEDAFLKCEHIDIIN